MEERKIHLAAMTDEEYAGFAEQQVAENAWQHVNAGEWEEGEARQLSREALGDLLADGLRKNGHQFLISRSGPDVVGQRPTQ